MSSKPFQFKEFTVAQDRCAMKIGTDGVLLGAWVDIPPHTESILDVGTGTGVIALMLAQHTDEVQVDAVELDPDAYEQAVENFEASDWGDRLFCYHAYYQELVEEALEDPEMRYDMIVSNPPFFENTDHEELNTSRKQARHQDTLTLEELIIGATHLLNEYGELSIIVPRDRYDAVHSIAKAVNLHVIRHTEVKGNASAVVKRSLITLSRKRNPLKQDLLVIEKSRHIYTENYIDLVQDFYLKM